MAEHAQTDEPPSELTHRLGEKIANAVRDARLPDVIYALVLEYSIGTFQAYSCPLYEVSRVALLASRADPCGLWNVSWAEEDIVAR
jgi:hypothetical protein